MKFEGVAIVVKTDDTIEHLDTIPDLAGLQKIVGGYIEIVNGRLDGEPVQLVFNEQGLLENLPPNTVATSLLQTSQFLVGNVIIAKQGTIT